MEGPTPVSALIHAATIVTAGVFLLIRMSFMFEFSPIIRLLILIFGASTALFSALTAVFLYDIKRIIAYSTCSQLGYIIFACGASQYSISLFHLINHAFFKALLFLTAGAIIHSFHNEQDIRKLSGLFFKSPFLFTAILVGNIAIMGIPFLSGFYSKDLIIEISALYNITYHKVPTNSLFLIMILATFCTGIYS
jgi:NADH-ubiquinone oxidoreductase chain 5